MSWFCSPRSEARGESASVVETHMGRCYCGAVEIEMRGDPLEMGYCHCENCRHYSAAPMSAFTLWKKEKVNVTNGEEFLGRFKSSEISERGYCTKCGGHISVEHPTLGSNGCSHWRSPEFPFKPKVHLNYAEYGRAGSRRMDGALGAGGELRGSARIKPSCRLRTVCPS
jgi:hypothetical protein